MKYAHKPVIVEATQWFKNGDHPLDYSKPYDGYDNGVYRSFTPEERKEKDWEGDIVRYYRNPTVPGETVCKCCGNTMHVHGWIDDSIGGYIVCPKDYIITGNSELHYPMKPDSFLAQFDLVVPM